MILDKKASNDSWVAFLSALISLRLLFGRDLRLRYPSGGLFFNLRTFAGGSHHRKTHPVDRADRWSARAHKRLVSSSMLGMPPTTSDTSFGSAFAQHPVANVWLRIVKPGYI